MYLPEGFLYRLAQALLAIAMLSACSAQPLLTIAEPTDVNGSYIPATPAAPLAAKPPAQLRQASVFNAGNRFTPWLGKDRYLGEVQPLLGKRCVSCHGCTDAPCQLKLTSFEYLQRGATKVSFFAPRLLEAPFPNSIQKPPPFHPVIQRRGDDNERLQQSLLHLYIQAGLANDPDSGTFDPAFLWPLQREQRFGGKHACAGDSEEFVEYTEMFPGTGMPMGLPALSQREYRTLQSWIADGAEGPVASAGAELGKPARPEVLLRWERFFNGEDNKSRLAARYLFEHVAALHVHFDEMPGEFYRLVRSSDVPGSAGVQELVTPLASDPPPARKFYYRFKKITALITRKDHTVWRVSDASLDYLRKLFLQTSWGVPDEEVQPVSWDQHSPFANFAQIPARLRYRFMLDNARTLIEAMVSSSACIGRNATYAISDHFWIFFLRPGSDVSSGSSNYRLGKDAWRALAANQDRYLSLLRAKDHYEANRVYSASYEKALRQELQAQVRQGKRARPGLGLQDLWNGGQSDANAWLTVLRHDTSATVHTGHRGGLPQTIWVLNYANFERIFYNLVVDFKYWGGLGHKIVTWQAMSQHRLEGEDLFLSLLPQSSRAELRRYYSGSLTLPARPLTGLIGKPLMGRKISRLIELYPMQSEGRPALTELPGQERADLEFVRLLKDYMGPRVTGSDPLNYPANGHVYSLDRQGWSGPVTPVSDLDAWERQVSRVLSDRGRRGLAQYLPGITYLRVGDAREQRVYTLISNRGYLAHELLFAQDQVRDPERDTLSLYPGLVGDYPELFLDVPLARTEALLRRLQLDGEQNAAQLMQDIRAEYGVARNSAAFWPFVDWLHDYMMQSPDGYIRGGILDLSAFGLYTRSGGGRPGS